MKRKIYDPTKFQIKQMPQSTVKKRKGCGCGKRRVNTTQTTQQ